MGDERNSSNKKRERKNDKEVVIMSPDRLSSLPDDTLINILSRLPFDNVVELETLSRRWLTLWTHVTCIDIENVWCPNGDTSDFWTAVHNTLSKLASPSSVERFSLELFYLYYYSPTGQCWSVIDSLADILRERNVREIEVRATGSEGHYASLTPTTTCVFQIRSLVSLKLGTGGYIAWSLPNKHDGYSIDVPNLKKLSLVVNPSQYALLEEVINSCPSLEELSFSIKPRANDLPSVLDCSIRVSSPTLKQLCISLYMHFNLIIEAPELEELTLTSCYFKSMYTEDDKTFLASIDSISHVKTLELDTKVGRLGNLVETLFPNMTRLTWILRSSDDFEVLASILHCPGLKVLVLELDRFSGSNTCKNLIPGNTTSTCMLLASVKRLELKTYDFSLDKHMLSLVGHLLGSAPVLEEFFLAVPAYKSSTRMTRNTEGSEFYISLMECPRSSSKCRVELIGA